MTPRVTFIPYVPAHLAALAPHVDASLTPLLDEPGYAKTLAVPGLSWTALAGDTPVGAGGVLPIWPGRALAWALVGTLPKTAWTAVTRQALAVLQHAHAQGHGRIEAHVDAAFANGVRWARLLGFAPEGLMRRFTADGRDHLLYARFG